MDRGAGAVGQVRVQRHRFHRAVDELHPLVRVHHPRRAAAVDVAKTEPLGADSPLWTAPNLTITPHVAGNRPIGGAALIDVNVARLAAGEDLLNKVDR